MAQLDLDKYACDVKAWRDWADLYWTATSLLFQSDNIAMYLPAATMAHHTLERYLKAALIATGATVCPRAVAVAHGISEVDFVWGHELLELALILAKRQPSFDPGVSLGIPVSVLEGGHTLLEGLGHFEPYFDELRYPRQLDRMEGVGKHEWYVLGRMVEVLRPFTFPTASTGDVQ
jgi:hypothetical protein